LQHAVFVWDLDETLVLMHSLVNGKFVAAAAAAGGAVQGSQVSALGRQVQRLVLRLSDDKMFFKEVSQS
jgi:hypothetical protein